MCIMCAVGDAVLEQRYYPEGAYWMDFAQYSNDNPRINGLVAFANAMIAFQNIVPISCVGLAPTRLTTQAVHLDRGGQDDPGVAHLG